MAVYALTGGLGAGKSLIAASRIRAALQAGLRVATNMDLNLEHLVRGRRGKYDVRRLPDYPTLEDFEALGEGCEGKFDEKKFGIIVLDEVAVFLNSREWNRDPNDEGPKEGAQKRAVQKRMALIKWLRHCRKHKWHLYLITQGLSSLDSQVREELIEHEVRCRRMDRLSVPVLSTVFKLLGFGRVPLPQVHAGVVYYMELGRPEKVDTWYVPDPKSLHPAYNTSQVLDGACLGATMLGPDRAPWLWPARRGSQNFASCEDARLARMGIYPCKPPPSLTAGYAEWLRGREAARAAIGFANSSGSRAIEPVYEAAD